MSLVPYVIEQFTAENASVPIRAATNTPSTTVYNDITTIMIIDGKANRRTEAVVILILRVLAMVPSDCFRKRRTNPKPAFQSVTSLCALHKIRA